MISVGFWDIVDDIVGGLNKVKFSIDKKSNVFILITV